MTILEQHLKKYGKMTSRDAVKLLFQSHFGCGHLVADEKTAIKRLSNEYSGYTAGEHFEDIGGGYVRAYINTFNSNELEILGRLFLLSASDGGDTKAFIRSLNEVKAHFKDGYVNEYLKKGIKPVSHSTQYRNAYRPAYRVIKKLYADYFDEIVFCGNADIVAIDGKCASGKTTLCDILLQVYGGERVSADDFFLPSELRTESRLNEPGGNIHYERFKAEVVENINKESFSYGVFSCKSMSVSGVREITKKPIFVEGSYSLHPCFGRYYDKSIYLDISAELQQERILNRNPQTAESFFNKWIPMENAYEKAFGIKNKADKVFFVG